MRITGRVDGRFDVTVAATPDGWVTAGHRNLTRWDGAEPRDPWVLDAPHPGRLAWVEAAQALAWGAQVVDGDGFRWSGAAWDVPRFAAVDGVVSGDAALVCVALRRPQSRTVGAPSVSDTSRLAIVDPAAGEVVEQLDPALPTAMLWGDGPLALGYPGRVDVRGDDGVWTTHDLGERTGVSRLAHIPEGLAVGTASGRLGVGSLHDAHDGPVSALAATDDGLLSGGRDGRLRRWAGGCELLDELDLGGAVLDLAAAGAQAVALVDDEGTSVVFIDLTS